MFLSFDYFKEIEVISAPTNYQWYIIYYFEVPAIKAGLPDYSLSHFLVCSSEILS